ncbi:MAG: hypothetical protein QM487_11410 [Candidatus Marithrix sp.]
MSELSIIKIIIISLQYLNLYYIADVFLVISLVLFWIAVYKNIKIISSLLTSFGIFITILIIFISISKFNTSTIENNLPDLLNGFSIALIFGFFNLSLVWILKLINTRRTVKSKSTEITPTAIYLTLRELSTYNNITQKPLLNNIFEQLRLIQENTQRIIEIHGISVSQELDLLKTIKNDIIDEGLLIKQVKAEITNGFNKLDKKNDIDKIQQGLQNIVNKIDLVSNTELAKSLQEIKPYLENLQQLHIQANDSFPKIEQNLTELTQGIQQVLQNNLELLKVSMETQLDMAEVSIENVQENKLATEESKSIYDKAFNNMDAGDYQNAIIYFDQVIELNSQEFSLFYNQACCYALLDQTELALKALQNAILLDKQCVEMASTDLDFDKIRYDPRFQVLLS